MAKAEDPFIKKMGEFEDAISAPKNIKQRALKIAFWFVTLPLRPLAKIYPFSLGADYGRIWNIYEKEGVRKSVEFGCLRIENSILKISKPAVFQRFFSDVEVVLTWALLARTVEYSYWDPRPEDVGVFKDFIERLGVEGKGSERADTFCALGILLWKAKECDEALRWTEKATQADDKSAKAFFDRGWYECMLGVGNPVESLFSAVKNDPDILRKIRTDEALARFPDFITAVDARAKQAGIYVI